MTLQELYGKIGLQQEIAEKLNGLQPGFSFPEELIERMMDMDAAEGAYRELDALLTEDRDHLKMLLCQMECARRTYGQYQAKGISDEIFVETMKCFTRFMDECGRMHGRLFFDRGWWTYRQISMSLFRIGALEYEFRVQEGEQVLSLHIPSDADLSPESVDRSLAQAEDFFRIYYPAYAYSRYICDSWLLSPKLKELLPEGSRILAFQERFRLLSADPEAPGFIQWIFQTPSDTEVRILPERTSLQRRTKALLLSGGSIGAAYGEIRRA